MNAANCPDELLVHTRSGALSQHDRVRLESHLAGCAACRSLLQVGQDFDEILGAQAGDDQIGARIAASFMKRRASKARPVLVATALLGSVAVAAATPQVREAVQTALFTSSASALPVRARAAPPTPAPAIRARAPRNADASARAPVAAPAAGSPSPAVTPTSSALLNVAPEPRESAAELFARANARRSSGEAREARRIYRELQQRFPGSKEALVSHVSLGRLEANGSPSAALRHFEAYLVQAPRGALAEEALFGRATAYEALGRAAEARATWRQLLQRFPASIYAKRARARVSTERVSTEP